MNTDPIFSAVEQLREVGGDGPATRKAVDALFRLNASRVNLARATGQLDKMD